MYNNHIKEATREYADTSDQRCCEAVNPHGKHQNASGQNQDNINGSCILTKIWIPTFISLGFLTSCANITVIYKTD